MLQNLIIYLHAGHLKMVDVHFLRGGGGSGKACVLHTLENGWQLWMTPYSMFVKCINQAQQPLYISLNILISKKKKLQNNFIDKEFDEGSYWNVNTKSPSPPSQRKRAALWEMTSCYTVYRQRISSRHIDLPQDRMDDTGWRDVYTQTETKYGQWFL